MRALAKTGLVAAGYAAAALLAWAVTAVYVFLTAGPDRQDYGAMFAFGDSLLCFGVFCVAALPATGLWLYFLREVAWFWSALAKLAIGASALSLSLLGCELLRWPEAALVWAPLWFMASPLFICGFGIAFFLAPDGATRRVLAWATALTGGPVGVLILFVLISRP